MDRKRPQLLAQLLLLYSMVVTNVTPKDSPPSSTYFLVYSNGSRTTKSELVVDCTTVNTSSNADQVWYNCTGRRLSGFAFHLDGQSCSSNCTSRPRFRNVNEGFSLVTPSGFPLQGFLKNGSPSVLYEFMDGPAVSARWIYMCQPEQVFRLCWCEYGQRDVFCNTSRDYDPCVIAATTQSATSTLSTSTPTTNSITTSNGDTTISSTMTPRWPMITTETASQMETTMAAPTAPTINTIAPTTMIATPISILSTITAESSTTDPNEATTNWPTIGPTIYLRKGRSQFPHLAQTATSMAKSPLLRTIGQFSRLSGGAKVENPLHASLERNGTTTYDANPNDFFTICLLHSGDTVSHVSSLEFLYDEDDGFNFTIAGLNTTVVANGMNCDPTCEGSGNDLSLSMIDFGMEMRFHKFADAAYFTIGDRRIMKEPCVWMYFCNPPNKTTSFRFSLCHSTEAGQHSCYFGNEDRDPCYAPSPLPTYATIAPTVLPIPPLKNISDIIPDNKNVGQILNNTLGHTDDPKTLDADDVSLVAVILSNCSKVVNMTSEQNNLFIKNIDNIMDITGSVLQKASSKEDDPIAIILNTLPRLVVNSAEDINYGGANMGLSGKAVDCSSGSSSENFGLTDEDNGFNPNYDSTEGAAAIELPRGTVCHSEATHTMLTIFRNRNLFVQRNALPVFGSAFIKHTGFSKSHFPAPQQLQGSTSTSKSDESCKIHQLLPSEGHVMTAALLNGVKGNETEMISRLSVKGKRATMVRLRIDVSKVLRPLHGEYQVTWWDTERLEWADYETCTVSMRHGVIYAECHHLTDFTLLINGLNQYPPMCDKTLTIIGYVVNNLSMVLLSFLVTMMSSAYFSNPRSNYVSYWIVRIAGAQRRNSMAIAYYSTLLLFYFFFTVFAEQKYPESVCVVFGAVTYCLLLSSIFMILFLSFRISRLFLHPSIVNNRFLTKFLHVRATITLSISIPALLTTFISLFTSFFKRQDGLCWVRPDYTFVGVVIPLSVVVLNSLLCTAMISIKLFFPGHIAKTTLSRVHDIKQRIVTIFLMQISLGTPWILQYLSLYKPYVTTWHYLFTIVNGGQGVMAFILWAYRRFRQYKVEGSSRTSSSKPLTYSSRFSDNEDDSI